MIRARQKYTDSHKRESAAAQPRPALGRRPWFALLRRARSLRRFALAIRRVSVAGSWRSLTLVDHTTGWAASPVAFAVRPIDRWLGVRAGHEMVLLRTGRVHGRGLRKPLRLVGLDETGTVVMTRILEPGTFAKLSSCSWVLETSPLLSPPAIGSVVAIYPRG